MSTTKAATIRKTLKTQHGWTSRQVSVRRDGCSINVTIKDPAVKEQAVREIAMEQRSVRYDEATQCILRGGNTFVSVRWDNAVLDAIAARLPLDDVKKPAEGATGSPTLAVGRLDIWRSNDHMDTWSWTIRREDGQDWDKHHAFTSKLEGELRDGGADPFRCWSREDCGRNIARAILHLGVDLDRPRPCGCRFSEQGHNVECPNHPDQPAKPEAPPWASEQDYANKVAADNVLTSRLFTAKITSAKRTAPKTITRKGDRYDRKMDVPEIAKRIRADIKAADLPAGLKTSVRCARYSMGRSITISVTACPTVVLNPERVRDDAAGKHADRPWRSAPGQAIYDTLEQIGQRYQKHQTTDQPDDWSYSSFHLSVDFDPDVTNAQRAGILALFAEAPEARIIPKDWRQQVA